jgi:hypothetical protein
MSVSRHAHLAYMRLFPNLGPVLYLDRLYPLRQYLDTY